MKLVTSLSKRFRVSLTLLTALAVLPLGSAFQSAEAKPKAGAPAYGYRAKTHKAKKQKRTSRRNDRNTARRNNRNDRYDDRRNDDRYDRDDRDYTTRYRTRTNDAGERIREYFRVYNR